MPKILSATYVLHSRTRLGNHAASGLDPFMTDGVATDPTAVTLTLLQPDGTETVWAWPTPGVGQSTATKEATGRFYADHIWDQAALHWCQLAGTGAVTVVIEFGVWVEALVVT